MVEGKTVFLQQGGIFHTCSHTEQAGLTNSTSPPHPPVHPYFNHIYIIFWSRCEITDKPPYVAHIFLQMSMSEKCNTLRRPLHFNFGGICDQSVMSLTPSGDPQPICCRPPKPRGRWDGWRGGGHIWLMMVWIKQKEMERILLSGQKHEWIKM